MKDIFMALIITPAATAVAIVIITTLVKAFKR